ncbi:hypothetical protein GQX73_g1794 [Xylaria multiplex]|uniref:Uncharacterized protein n=1 Tax=Xylaria multiplex TaxID=323545 RepID=A0A7C8IVY9_9PEZI|nr:hypothetical protein GQX73_g1794 [Xylaria multiplex]
MSSTGDSDSSFGKDGNDDTPTHNQPWPYVDPFSQGRFERKYIEDGGTINFDSLPKLQPWASWAGISDLLRVLTVLKKVKSHAAMAQRRLTSTEARAIGEHSAHSVRYLSWIQPVSCTIAIAIAASKRRTFSFPFYRPKMKKFDPFSFPTKRLRFLKGHPATLMWHVVRFGAYLPFAWFPTTIFFSSMAENSFAAHAWRDPRLDGVIQHGRQNHQKLQHQREQARRQAGFPDPARTVPPKNPQQPGDEAYGDSPTPQSYESTDYAAQPSSTFGKPSPVTEASRATQPDWARGTATRSAPPKVQENALPDPSPLHENDGSGLFDDDDDASPVALPARRQDAGQRQSSLSGSSWDRIRQQAKSGNANWEKGDSSGEEHEWGQLRQDKIRNPRDSTPKTDSYSYTTEDEEREKRNYEREQAQKDFDALLEAERHGESGSGGNRGWRK